MAKTEKGHGNGVIENKRSTERIYFLQGKALPRRN